LLHPFDFGDCAVVPAGADADRLGSISLLGLRGRKVDVLVIGVLDGEILPVLALGRLNALAEVGPLV
jgi:hypothetical protein